MGRLAERFAADDLPDVIDLPTGSAKTEIVVVWAWARGRSRRVPRRLWIASDRRVIVDQAFEVARPRPERRRRARARACAAGSCSTTSRSSTRCGRR